MRDIALLREVQRLSQEDGVNLAGIKRIIELENQVDALRARLAELTEELAAAYVAAEQAAAAAHASYRRDLVPFNQQTSMVVWRPKPRCPPRLRKPPRATGEAFARQGRERVRP